MIVGGGYFHTSAPPVLNPEHAASYPLTMHQTAWHDEDGTEHPTVLEVGTGDGAERAILNYREAGQLVADDLHDLEGLATPTVRSTGALVE